MSGYKCTYATLHGVADNGYRSAEVEIEVEYHEHAPLELVMTFLDGENEPVWFLSRDLFLEALKAPGYVGDGDVRIVTGLGSVVMTLSSPEGAVVIRMPERPLRSFLEATKGIVEPGQEDLSEQIEEAIEELLS